MKAATGFSRHKIYVSCPNCNCTFDALDFDTHNLMFTYYEPKEQADFDLKLDCPSCDLAFILESIEYQAAQ